MRFEKTKETPYDSSDEIARSVRLRFKLGNSIAQTTAAELKDEFFERDAEQDTQMLHVPHMSPLAIYPQACSLSG